MSLNVTPQYVFSLFENMKSHEVLMCYFGNVTFKVSNNLINALKENLEADELHRVVQKKVYSSFVECIENITRHTTSDLMLGDRFGIISVSKTDGNIIIYSGNLMKKKGKTDFMSKINSLKSQSKAQLKVAYKKQLVDGSISEKGGAGLGLLQIAINSEGNFDCTFQDVDDEKEFLMMEISIPAN